MLLDLRELDLPMYNPDDDEPGEAATRVIESCYSADGLIWSSPLYQGTISGALKNALDWLHLLGPREPSYLHDKVIGLISAAGGTQGRSTRWSSLPGRSAAGPSPTSSPSRRPPSRLLGSAGFLLGRPLGRRESLETLVRNRLAAFDREAVGPCGKPGFGALEGGELVA